MQQADALLGDLQFLGDDLLEILHGIVAVDRELELTAGGRRDADGDLVLVDRSDRVGRGHAATPRLRCRRQMRMRRRRRRRTGGSNNSSSSCRPRGRGSYRAQVTTLDGINNGVAGGRCGSGGGTRVVLVDRPHLRGGGGGSGGSGGVVALTSHRRRYVRRSRWTRGVVHPATIAR